MTTLAGMFPSQGITDGDGSTLIKRYPHNVLAFVLTRVYTVSMFELKPKELASEAITLRLTKTEREVLEKLASRSKTTMTDVIRHLLKVAWEQK